MTTTKLKSDLFRFIEEINDENILTSLRNMLASKSRRKQKDFWDDLTEKEKNEILKAIEEIDNGKYFEFSEVIAKHKKK
jgi:hypothetical protein